MDYEYNDKDCLPYEDREGDFFPKNLKELPICKKEYNKTLSPAILKFAREIEKKEISDKVQ